MFLCLRDELDLGSGLVFFFTISATESQTLLIKSSKFSFEEKVFLSKFLFSLLEDTVVEAEGRTALSYCKVGVQPVQ